MIRREADGYYVELRAQRYGRPVGPVIRWGPYGTRADAQAVERRNRARLTGTVLPGDGPKPTRARQPLLLDVS